ncbi:hypothetical protein PR001_g25345 [Phytophthora rubi]|uniref:Uncharacterized protein n=1 Tax=Phytophthora rubi TaxID=129364 RepID=A0A6A3I3M9_9STRA|nr:hypothetical protein PR001_g25345 [Phytophthora rubi]
MTSPPLLLSVSRAVPEATQAIPHLCQSINSFLLPLTVDSAVYNDLQRVLHTFGAFVPWTTRAMDGAAAKGRLAIVQRLVATRSEGCSAQAFIGAAANGHLEVLQWLRQQEPYADLYNASDCLTAAAEGGQVDAVRTIRRERERVGYFYQGEFVGPAMKAAANRGDVDVLEALKPWPFDRTGAFSAAAVQGHVLVLGILYSHCRGNRSRILRSSATLMEVAERGNCDVVEFLLRICDENDAELMLFAAARAGQTSVVQLILRSCKIRESGMFHALREGIDKCSYDAVELLLDQCRTEDEGCSNPSLIRSAVKGGDVKMVGILAKRCESVAMGNALEKAAESGNRDMVKLLLDTCATRNLYDSIIRLTVAVAAKQAIFYGDVEVAKLLLNECDGSVAGQALENAVKSNHLELVEICAEKGDNLYKIMALVEAAQGEHIQVVETLMKYLDESSILRALQRLPCDVNIFVLRAMLNKCEPARYPEIFADAAARGFRGLVECLQNEMDSQSIRWALMSAAANGHTEVVNALLRSCDSTSIGCALEAAAMRGQVGVVDLLRGHSDAESISSALAAAEEADHIEVVRLLDSKKARLM